MTEEQKEKVMKEIVLTDYHNKNNHLSDFIGRPNAMGDIFSREEDILHNLPHSEIVKRALKNQ
ncbi:hypothetical protein GVAV_003422 [Gurleya vavrai]